MHVAELSKEKVINEGHLKYVLDEFIESFENDIVIKDNISKDKMDYIIYPRFTIHFRKPQNNILYRKIKNIFIITHIKVEILIK